MSQTSLYYDWNTHDGGVLNELPQVRLHDETLRDGLQSASARDPDIDVKLRFVDLLETLGVYSACVGLPGANARSYEHTDSIVGHVQARGHALEMAAAARTHPPDIEPIIEISERHGRPVTAMMFLGSSTVRMYTEHWTMEKLEQWTRDGARCAVQGGLPAALVTEDTTRAAPETLERLYATAIEEGVTRLVLCDTVGHATPDGVFALVRWVRERLDNWGVADQIELDWHGHDDRGLALTCALYAAAAGCSRLHGTILGIGERVGNAPLDQLMINLALIHTPGEGLTALSELTDMTAEALEIPIPPGYPVFGRDAFRTATGVHAAAIIKALDAGDPDLADRVYSAVPARYFGRSQVIEIGHMSGRSNVRHWLQAKGLEVTEARIDAIFRAAKACPSTLEDAEMLAIVHALP